LIAHNFHSLDISNTYSASIAANICKGSINSILNDEDFNVLLLEIPLGISIYGKGYEKPMMKRLAFMKFPAPRFLKKFRTTIYYLGSTLDTRITFYNIMKNRAIGRIPIKGHFGSLETVGYDDGALIAIGFLEGWMSIYTGFSRKFLNKFRIFPEFGNLETFTMHYCKRFHYLLTLTYNGILNVWNVLPDGDMDLKYERRLQLSLKDQLSGYPSLLALEDENLLFVATTNSVLYQMKLSNGQLLSAASFLSNATSTPNSICKIHDTSHVIVGVSHEMYVFNYKLL